jgi:hypothetical protein
MIPATKRWRVRWYRDGQLRDTAYVSAPTRFLAKLNLRFERPDLWLANWDSDRVTYSVMGEKSPKSVNLQG